jgi:two-component system cell cycle sensor histidine kinase/response regulator CckA
VEGYGGKIFVKSELDRGTTFTVYLPATKLHPLKEENPYKNLPRGLERILFVDDEPSIVEMAGQLLGALGV